MGKLLTSPLTMTGELYDVHLFNFIIPVATVIGRLPRPLQPVLVGERAVISLVRATLRHMRPQGCPRAWGMQYTHLAYRLLVDCPTTRRVERGIYFLESFADSPLFCTAGNWLSEYRFNPACLEETADAHYRHLQLISRDGYHRVVATLDYDVPPPAHAGNGEAVSAWQERVGPLIQAFSVSGRRVSRVAVSRERWPLVPVSCPHFAASAFPEAQFAVAFRVPEVIPYVWHAAQSVDALWPAC